MAVEVMETVMSVCLSVSQSLFLCCAALQIERGVFFVPRLNEVEEGGYLNYPPSVRLSVRTAP